MEGTKYIKGDEWDRAMEAYETMDHHALKRPGADEAAFLAMALQKAEAGKITKHGAWRVARGNGVTAVCLNTWLRWWGEATE